MRIGGTRCFGCDARIARTALASKVWRDERGSSQHADGVPHVPGAIGTGNGIPQAGVDYVIVRGGRFRCLWCGCMNLIPVATSALVRLIYERHSCGVPQPDGIADLEMEGSAL